MFNPQALRDQIERKPGLSLSKLAQALNSDRALVSAWANGRREPLLESVVRLAEVFDCPVDALVFRGQARIDEIARRKAAIEEAAESTSVYVETTEPSAGVQPVLAPEHLAA